MPSPIIGCQITPQYTLHAMEIDFDRTSEDYANHRIEFAPALFDRLRGMNVGVVGQRMLDLGAGTGLLADQLLRQGCDVTLIDRSLKLLEHAAAKNRIVGSAEQ